MSTSYVLIVFALVIVLMIVLISKCKVNAAMGILLFWSFTKLHINCEGFSMYIIACVKAVL